MFLSLQLYDDLVLTHVGRRFVVNIKINFMLRLFLSFYIGVCLMDISYYSVDIYSSHEGQVYCKPHFRELFKPKAVVDEDVELRKLMYNPLDFVMFIKNQS
jgi:hypothetical protein